MLRKPHGFKGEVYRVVPPNVRERAHLEPLLQPLTVTDIGRFPKAAGHYRTRRMGAPEHILILCENGAGFAEINDYAMEVPPEHFLLIPRHTAHAYGAQDERPWTISWCHVIGEEADLLVSRSRKPAAPVRISSAVLVQARSLFDMAFDIMDRGFTLEHLVAASALVRGILSLLIFENDADGRPQLGLGDTRLEAAVRHINQHMYRSIAVTELAEVAGISPSRLHQLFRGTIGESPSAYMRTLRISRAQHYLDATDIPVYHVAELVGFADPLHFSRVFRRTVGCSPRAYRNRNRSADR